MQFNLFKGLKSQARRAQKAITDMSPKMVDVISYTGTQQINPKAVNRKAKRYASTTEAEKILNMRIKALLEDRKTKEARYEQQDKLAKASIYDVLLDYFMEDAFGIDPDDNVVSVDILDDDTDMRTLLEVFPNDYLERNNVEELLTNNLKNKFLKYGELFFKKQYTNKLVTSWEVLDGKYIYPICNGTGILFYIQIDPIKNDFEIIEAKEIVAFLLRPEPKSIVYGDTKLESLLSEQSDEFKAEIPDSFMLGTPLLYNARNELTSLRITSIMADLNKLKKLATPSLVGVNVESIRDEDQLTELLDTYEEYFEDIIQLPEIDGEEEDVDVDSFLNTSIKAIPIEGSGKNGIQSIDLSSMDTSSLNEDIDKKKEDVALASGFPLSALSPQSDSDSKSDMSSNRRYRNKCKSAQRFIVRPLHEELLADFEVQNIDVSPSQVKVFCKPIVSLDSAEDLEISIGAITQLSEVWEALQTISETSSDYCTDEDGYFDYFNELLGSFKGAKKLLKKKIAEAEEDTLLGDEPPANDNIGHHRVPSVKKQDTEEPETNTPTNEGTEDRLDRVGIEEDLGGGAELVTPEGETNE